MSMRRETGSCGLICCISFQLGFCCCSHWHIWAHVADSRTVHILRACCPGLLRSPGLYSRVSGGPGPGQGCAAVDGDLSSSLCLGEEPAGHNTHRDMQRLIIQCHTAYLSTERRTVRAGVSQPCAHLPRLFCLSPSSSVTCFSISLF